MIKFMNNYRHSIPGFANPKCYARALGNCCRQMSREHFSTHAMLKRIAEYKKQVLTRNLPFGRNTAAPRPLDIDGKDIAPKILCAFHNTGLEDYDSAGLTMLEAMKAIDDESRCPVEEGRVFTVNGDGLERWILKAHLGGLYCGALHWLMEETAERSIRGQLPPVELLGVLYQDVQFQPGQGLCWLGGLHGGPITTDDEVLRIGVDPSKDGKTFGAFRAVFFGFEFDLLLGRLARGAASVFDRAAYRPAGLRVEGVKTEVRFHWAAGPGSERIVLQRT
jgi:hypothetical protein